MRQSFIDERRVGVERVRVPKFLRGIRPSGNKKTEIHQRFVYNVGEDNADKVDSHFSPAESVADTSENIPIVKVELFHEFLIFRNHAGRSRKMLF